MDIPINFNLHQLLIVQVGISILGSVSVSPTYNLPIHLYGLYNLDHLPITSDGLRQYSILLMISIGLDLIWLYNWSNSISSLSFLLILIGLILKPIGLISCLSKLNQSNGTTGFTQAFTHHSSNPIPLPNQSVSPNQFRGFQRDPTSNGFKTHLNSTRQGPSSISHQSQSSHLINPNSNSNKAYHEFDLDSDAQNLSDDDLKFAQQELQNRITQKQQQSQSKPQQSQSQQESLIESNLIQSPIKSLISSEPLNSIGKSNEQIKDSNNQIGYHTIE